MALAPKPTAKERTSFSEDESVVLKSHETKAIHGVAAVPQIHNSEMHISSTTRDKLEALDESESEKCTSAPCG